MSAPLFRIARHSTSTAYRIACVVSCCVALLSGAAALYGSEWRVALSFLAALSGIVAALTLHGLIFPWTIEVILCDDRIEWGVVGKLPRGVAHRRDVTSVLLGTGMDHDNSYAFLRNGTKVEIGMLGGPQQLELMAAAIREHWPETPVAVDAPNEYP